MVLPAILTDKKEELKYKLNIAQNFAKWIHIDVMDGRFVENETFFDLDFFKNIDWGEIKKEWHLMVEKPNESLESFMELPGNRLVFHIESDSKDNIIKICKEVLSSNFDCFLAINPSTDFNKIINIIEEVKIEGVLIMGVKPGFSGQKIKENIFERVSKLDEIRPDLTIEIDGGVKKDNAFKLYKNGADNLIAASYIFEGDNPKERFLDLRN